MNINELNISIFDFIFNVNMQKDISNYDEYGRTLDKLIMELTNSDSNYEFWKEHKYLVSSNSLVDATTLDSYQYVYASFPKMTTSAINNYLNYKVKQLKAILDDNFNYDFENIGKDLNINNDFALKIILDFMIENKILIKTGEYTKKNILGTYIFEFENLKVNNNVNHEAQIFNQTIVNNHGTMAYSYSGNATVHIQNQEELFKIVLEKIEAMRAENVPNDKLEELINNCKEKNSSKVISLLQSIALEVSSSMVVRAILTMFGIPC